MSFSYVFKDVALYKKEGSSNVTYCSCEGEGVPKMSHFKNLSRSVVIVYSFLLCFNFGVPICYNISINHVTRFNEVLLTQSVFTVSNPLNQKRKYDVCSKISFEDAQIKPLRFSGYVIHFLK